MSSEGFDIGALLQQAQAMQEQLLEAQAAAAEEEVEGVAGGGAVKIVLTGGLEFRSVRIDPSAVDPQDVAMLEDLILAALNDGIAKAQELTQEATSEAMGGLELGALGGSIPGLGAGPAAH
jgi:DNA-binding YbaB/EbfC family protein